jgi:hypothetical protein
MVDLKKHLNKADAENQTIRKSATLHHFTTGGSAATPSPTDEKCKMCLFLKEEISFSNLKGHITGTPCPELNIDIMNRYFGDHPHVSGKGQGVKTKSQPSGKAWGSTPTYPPKFGDSRGPDPNRLPEKVRSRPPLINAPPDFNSSVQCIHCYRSYIAGGKDSEYRGTQWRNHGSEQCRAGYNASTRAPNHGSGYITIGTQQVNRSGRESNKHNRSPERVDRGPIGGYAHEGTSSKRSRSRGESYSPTQYRSTYKSDRVEVLKDRSPPRLTDRERITDREREREQRRDSRERSVSC